MKMKSTFIAATLLLVSVMTEGGLSAQNPIVQTCFTTDPAPMVHDGTLYVYTGHDEDKADFFWMQEWRVYSTKDMVNWTDHGSPLAIESFDWADDRAWAAQCVERNGKFYWYVCLHSKLSNTMAIGVAVGDSPVGPFKDAIGKPLHDGSWDYIDPTVFIDLVHPIRKSVSKVLSIKILIQKVHGFINGKENIIFFMLPEVYPNILPIP